MNANLFHVSPAVADRTQHRRTASTICKASAFLPRIPRLRGRKGIVQGNNREVVQDGFIQFPNPAPTLSVQFPNYARDTGALAQPVSRLQGSNFLRGLS